LPLLHIEELSGEDRAGAAFLSGFDDGGVHQPVSPGRADVELVAREDGGVAGVGHAPGLTVQRRAGAGALAEVVALPGLPVLFIGAGIGARGAAVVGGRALEGLFGEPAGLLLAAEERPRPVDV